MASRTGLTPGSVSSRPTMPRRRRCGASTPRLSARLSRRYGDERRSRRSTSHSPGLERLWCWIASHALSYGAVFFAERDRTVRPSSMKLKAALRKIDPDNDNLFHERLSFHLALMTPPIWHIAMPSGGDFHSINIPRRSTVISSHLRSLRRYDEPKTLSCSVQRSCPTSADWVHPGPFVSYRL